MCNFIVVACLIGGRESMYIISYSAQARSAMAVVLSLETAAN